MKKTLTIIFLFAIQFVISQTFVVKLNNNVAAKEFPIINDKVNIIGHKGELKNIFLTVKEPIPNDKDYKVSIVGQGSTFDLSSEINTIEVKGGDGYDLSGQTIEIIDKDGYKQLVELIVENSIGENDTSDSNEDDIDAENDEASSQTNFRTPEEIVAELFPDIIYKQRVGLMVSESNENTRFGGERYVHIFLDGYGNPILRSIPQGSPEKTYVVHIVTSVSEVALPNIRYNIKQTAGGIDDLLLFRNTGKLDGFGLTSGSTYKIYHYEIVLTESNKNIVFEVNIGTISDSKLTNTKLSTHTIPIKIYNGSFDVGLISSELENPNYSFVATAGDNSMGKIKDSEGGKRGIVTTMATFYASPIILLEKFIFKPKDKNGNKIDIPNYKLTGRNFVEDHKIYERIYPTVGLSVNEKALENIFYGFNFEAVRGASLFVGWHHGRVNTFNISDTDFSFNESVISKENFDLNTKQTWKTDFAIGVNLDVLVILNLLQQSGSATK